MSNKLNDLRCIALYVIIGLLLATASIAFINPNDVIGKTFDLLRSNDSKASVEESNTTPFPPYIAQGRWSPMSQTDDTTAIIIHGEFISGVLNGKEFHDKAIVILPDPDDPESKLSIWTPKKDIHCTLEHDILYCVNTTARNAKPVELTKRIPSPEELERMRKTYSPESR